MTDEITRGAEFSHCGLFRYTLHRSWEPEREPRIVGFVMLNPSTADAEQDDPTIRRCIGFAQREGYNDLLIGNVYGFRATDPGELLDRLRRGHDVVGPGNDAAIAAIVNSVDEVVCAWGTNARAGRIDTVSKIIAGHRRVSCLGTTKAGHPCHPLYLKASTPLEAFPGPS